MFSNILSIAMKILLFDDGSIGGEKKAFEKLQKHIPLILEKEKEKYKDFVMDFSTNENDLLKDFDVIHINNFSKFSQVLKIMFAKLIGRKIVYSVHNFPKYDKLDGKDWKKKFQNEIMEDIANRIIVPSHFLQMALNRINVEVIPHGIDLEECEKTKKMYLDGEPALLYVGRLEYVKGADILYKIIESVRKECPKAVLHVVGEGSLSQKMAEQESEFFKLYGFVDDDVKYQMLSSANACIVPSRMETFCITILEAIACNCPIIASDIGAIPELIRHNSNGFLVSFNVKNFSSAASSLMKNKKNSEFMERIARNGIETAKRYEWKDIAKKYIDYYSELK